MDKINGLENWRRILGTSEPDIRKRDIELILRFLAMQDVAAYSKPMKSFLSKFMQKIGIHPRISLGETKKYFEKLV